MISESDVSISIQPNRYRTYVDPGQTKV
jgi:hypothetical protein